MKKNLSNIKKALNYLNNDDCIAIPTETVYGLAGNAYSDKATSKIFKLKKRPKKNPLIVHYYDLQYIKKDCVVNKNFIKFYKKFCPGPISFVLKLKKNSLISKNVTNKKKTIAVRFPQHPITRSLLKNLKYPLAAPSANISSKISPVSKKDVLEESLIIADTRNMSWEDLEQFADRMRIDRNSFLLQKEELETELYFCYRNNKIEELVNG